MGRLVEIFQLERTLLSDSQNRSESALQRRDQIRNQLREMQKSTRWYNFLARQYISELLIYARENTDH